MSYEVTKPGNPLEDFKQKVLEKLKADIGSLMPDEVLQGLVQQALQQSLFDPVKVRDNERSSTYSEQFKMVPSWFMQAIAEQAKPLLAKHIEAFVESHQADLEEAFTKFTADQNLMLMAFQLMLGKSYQLEQRLMELSSRLHQLGQR